MNPDLDWHRHRAASKRRVRVRFEAHLFVPGFLSVGNYNTTLSSNSLETGTGSSNSLCSGNESKKLVLTRVERPTAKKSENRQFSRSRPFRQITLYAAMPLRQSRASDFRMGVQISPYGPGPPSRTLHSI